MRHDLRLDDKTSELFELSASERFRADELLAALGSTRGPRSAAALALPCLPDHLADLMSDRSILAALHRSALAPWPWPWMAAAFERELRLSSETREGAGLYVALLAVADAGAGPLSAPAGLQESLRDFGACPAAFLRDPLELRSWGPARKARALDQLRLHRPFEAPESWQASSIKALALPLAMPSSRFGPTPESDLSRSEMLRQSLAETALRGLSHAQARGEIGEGWALLGIDRFDRALRLADQMSAPLELRAKIDSLCRLFHIPASELAVSVSFHQSLPELDSELPEDHQPPVERWMRVAVRDHVNGFALDGMEWPSQDGLEAAFDRLLDTLADIGVVWLYQIEGVMGPFICPHCRQPQFPAPSRDDWRQAALDAGVSPDGSHRH